MMSTQRAREIGRRLITARLAEQLRRAQSSKVPISAFSERFPDLSIAEAYDIQHINIAHRVRCGDQVVGRKVTDAAPLRHPGASHPHTGLLTSRMLVAGDARLTAADFILPRVRPAIAVKLTRPVHDPSAPGGLDDIVGEVMLAAEIADSRIEGRSHSDADMIADNLGTGRVILGDAQAPTADLLRTPVTAAMSSRAVGEKVAQTHPPTRLHDAIGAIALLVATLRARGESSRPDELILIGCTSQEIALTPDHSYAIHADGFAPLRFETIEGAAASPADGA